ncbi:hypothetical protein DNTS_004106, partial [Danionella cerebrum]
RKKEEQESVEDEKVVLLEGVRTELKSTDHGLERGEGAGVQHISHTHNLLCFQKHVPHLQPQHMNKTYDSSEVREDLQQQQDEVAQWWGEWSSWSTCSRTCGGGVRSQERHCLQQRLMSTQNINSSFCTGPSKQYQLCTNQPCPSSRISFKQHQCSQFNAKAFGRKHYEWVPLYPDDYINISNKPCDLQCTTTSGERQLLVPAHDGTFCRDRLHQGTNVEYVVETEALVIVSLELTGKGSHSYIFITNIPFGATDIQIIERRKTENILALSDEAGHFFFNGNSMIDNPQNFHVAGTVFKYRRPVNLFSDGFEYIMAQGPTQQALNYYNLNGKVPHITYEYTVPRVLELRLVSPMSSTPEQPQISNLMSKISRDPPGAEPNTSSSEHAATHNEIQALKDLEKKTNKSTLVVQDHMALHEELLRDLQTSVNLSEQHTLDLVSLPVSEVLQNELEDEMHHLEVQGHFGPDSNLIDGDSSSSSDSNQTSIPTLKDLFYEEVSWASSSRHPCKEPSKLSGCAILQLNSSSSLDNSLTLEIFPGSLDLHSSDVEASTNDSVQHQMNILQLQNVEPVQTPHTESNEFDVESLDPDISISDMYRWKVSAYAPCSSTCTTGISTSYALCVKYDGSEVDESYCDALTRPEPTHEFCTGKECLPRWESSRWSECSRTCGEGFQFRTVRCWKMMAPGFDSSVYDELCQGVDLQKPITRKACKSKSCGPQWEISEWSECSARCGGHGVKSREVRCSMEARLCNESSRPVSQRECEGPPCDRRWTVSDWGPCSGACGDGRMRRYVVCKNSNGKVISDGQCDPELKPLAVHPCGDKNCPAHWVEQEWEQCNATCGRGVRQRQVVCAGLEAGVFKEFPESMCDGTIRPADSSACFERPCSKWFTTSWSQCSKTCGTGVRVREVKCYQGEELGHSCDLSLRPEARQSCEVQPCTTDPPAEEDCQDKATANCGLVLRVKLCTHWYYRKACCLSCSIKSQ